jgi:hypothetical protein
VTAPLVVRPVRLTRVCRAAAVLLVLVFTVVAVSLRQGGGADVFGVADQVAMVVLGLLLAAVVLAFTRARVEADERGVRVRNVLGERTLPWQVVRGVRLDEGSPWASLDLHDDDTVALLAVQANDRERAVRAVIALRELLAASRTP